MLLEKIMSISDHITLENKKQHNKLKSFSISEHFKISLFIFISFFAFSLIDFFIKDFLIFKISYLQAYYGFFLFFISSVSLYFINKRFEKYFYYAISEQVHNIIHFVLFYFIVFIIISFFYFLSGFYADFVSFFSYIGISKYSFLINFLLFINLSYSFFYFNKKKDIASFNEIKNINKKVVLAKKERDSIKDELLKDNLEFEKLILSLKKEEQHRNNLLNDDSYNSLSDDIFAYLMEIINEYDNKKMTKHNINEKWNTYLKQKDFSIQNL